jgi:hypothetical protein
MTRVYYFFIEGFKSYKTNSPQKKIEILLKLCDEYEKREDWLAVKTLASEALLHCNSTPNQSILYTIHHKRYIANKKLKYFDLAWWDTVRMVQLDPSPSSIDPLSLTLVFFGYLSHISIVPWRKTSLMK